MQRLLLVLIVACGAAGTSTTAEAFKATKYVKNEACCVGTGCTRSRPDPASQWIYSCEHYTGTCCPIDLRKSGGSISIQR
jgi:hypothetical protein